MRIAQLIFLLLFIVSKLTYAETNQGESVKITGVNNPMSFTISPDGLSIIIIDRLKKGQLIMKHAQRQYTESTWSVADEFAIVKKQMGEETVIEAPCFSHDGEFLFFSANFNDTKGGMDIYYCRYYKGVWSEPVNVGAPINSELNERNPSISGNYRSLYFTRDIEMKGLDKFQTGEMWCSEMGSGNILWQEPRKLDKVINNGGITQSKVFNDNKTFYFSKITNDKEKWQLFWAKKYGDIHWFLPTGIDTLNSKESEMCPVFCKQEGSLYFIVNRNSDENPNNSLYRMKLEARFLPEKTIKIKGKVSDAITNSSIDATIQTTNPILGDLLYFARSDKETGEWKMLLNAGEDMMLHAWAPGYSHIYKLFDQYDTNNDIQYDLKLFKEVGLTLNIYDSEELWPLESVVTIKTDAKTVDIPITTLHNGKQKMILPIGSAYTLLVNSKDYFDNSIEIDLSGIVLFNDFVRDIELVPIKRQLTITVSDEETGAPLVADIEIIENEKHKKVVPEMVNGVPGSYSILLREGKSYGINVRGPKGFAFHHNEIDLGSDRMLKQLDFRLKPLKTKIPIKLNNINFEYNSADLLESSYEELIRLIQLINDNPDIKVEIMAHTDDLGSDQYNAVLAEKRAASVVRYLIRNGVLNNRLFSKGYGESVPLVPNTSDENRAINRRVEMRILDKDDHVINEIEK